MKKHAFTLAEVLLVISIIGIISALVLPNLSQDTNDAEVVAKVKKVHSVLGTAISEAQEKYGEDLTTWYSASNTDEEIATIFGKRLLNYLNVSKICGLENDDNCFSTTGKIGSDEKVYKFVLNDGMSIGIVKSTIDVIEIIVDIDGLKGYDKIGQDLFSFMVDADGRFLSDYPLGTPKLCRMGASQLCTEWVLRNNNIDYLKCNDLSATKTTCN